MNWDPIDQTVLANEQVDAQGRSWRSGAVVEQRQLKQWFLRITAYADELDSQLDLLTKWPPQVRSMQHNWIGRREGALVKFAVVTAATPAPVEVFTTRLDTLAGVAFLALAHDHPLALQYPAPASSSSPTAMHVEHHTHGHGVNDSAGAHLPVTVASVCSAPDSGSLTTSPDGTHVTSLQGRRLPVMAVNPLTGLRVPIWVADYVISDYGTGACMMTANALNRMSRSALLVGAI